LVLSREDNSRTASSSVGDDVAARNGSYLYGVSHLSTRLGARPVEITNLDDLPKNAVGKIAKPSLRRRLAATH
jgi:acyl-CoA synthetase (AMP-forming)/AMP-acid ligase II